MSKFTAGEIRAHVDKIRLITESHRRVSKLENFMSLSPEQTEEKLRRVNSPFYTSAAWGAAIAGKSMHFDLVVYNPDPAPWHDLHVHTWVGSSSVDRCTGRFIVKADPRFPRLAQPNPIRFSIAANGGTVPLSFSLKVPTIVDKASYTASTCLTPAEDIEKGGTYLDRSVFPFAVL
jgi:hypothetical protein